MSGTAVTPVVVCQHGGIARVLQVKEMIGGKFMSEGGLTRLPGTEDAGNRESRHERGEHGPVCGSVYLVCHGGKIAQLH